MKFLNSGRLGLFIFCSLFCLNARASFSGDPCAFSLLVKSRALEQLRAHPVAKRSADPLRVKSVLLAFGGPLLPDEGEWLQREEETPEWFNDRSLGEFSDFVHDHGGRYFTSPAAKRFSWRVTERGQLEVLIPQNAPDDMEEFVDQLLTVQLISLRQWADMVPALKAETGDLAKRRHAAYWLVVADPWAQFHRVNKAIVANLGKYTEYDVPELVQTSNQPHLEASMAALDLMDRLNDLISQAEYGSVPAELSSLLLLAESDLNRFMTNAIYDYFALIQQSGLSEDYEGLEDDPERVFGVALSEYPEGLQEAFRHIFKSYVQGIQN